MTTTEEAMMTDRTETRCRDCDGYNCDNGCAYPPKEIEMRIPDDVMEAAKQCTRDMFIDPLAPMWPHIARAILAERERAARIAGNFLMLNSGLDVVKVVQCEDSIIRSVDK